ncbi:hypothetical protein [Streptomyces syringium]|uniref:hypothetical protein n=1 Tax=Streptomyces syringium TaxID=76729 RepID=UPI00344A3268
MGRNKHRTGPQAGHVCPVCRHPVETVVERHRLFGIFVPVWGPGPCRNPDCAAYAADPEERTPRP